MSQVLGVRPNLGWTGTREPRSHVENSNFSDIVNEREPTGQRAMDSSAVNGVAIEQVGDEWVAQVLEDGSVDERRFVLEAHARSYAVGQRIRLGLPPTETDE